MTAPLLNVFILGCRAAVSIAAWVSIAMASYFDEFTVFDVQFTIGVFRDGDVVADHDDGLSFFVQVREQVEYFDAGFFVEIACRFVREEDVGIIYKRSSDCDSLSFAA